MHQQFSFLQSSILFHSIYVCTYIENDVEVSIRVSFQSKCKFSHMRLIAFSFFISQYNGSQNSQP